jgi:hypothetical protein
MQKEDGCGRAIKPRGSIKRSQDGALGNDYKSTQKKSSKLDSLNI